MRIGRFIVATNAHRKEKRKMDWKKTEDIIVRKMKRALSVILEYANTLALTDLKGNQDKLKRWKQFTTGMAQYYCVEGHEEDCDDMIEEKYTMPFERMLEGNRDALAGIEAEEISGEHIKEAIDEIERYRRDMITEHCTGYEADIEACSSLIEGLSEWHRQVEGQRENTGEIEALEGEKIEEGSTGEDEEQGQKMQGM
jgi:hypothetical protein